MANILKKSIFLSTFCIVFLVFAVALDKVFSSGFSIYENICWTIVFLFLFGLILSITMDIYHD